MKDSTGSNKDDKEDSEELWDEETNEEINPSSVKTDEEKYDPSNPTSSTQSNLPSVPIPGKTQVPKAAYPYLTMQEKLTSLVEPIVGLENVVEHHIETGDMPPYYECQLCKSDMADANLINHLKGRGHRMNYIQTKNVEKYGSITNLPSYNVGKAMLDTIKEMEEEFGRGFMPIVIDKDVLKHPDSKNYQVHREKMKENEKNTQKRSFGQSDNTFNNKERKKKRGIIGKNENKGNITIGKGPISSTSLKRNNANNWPTNNFNNMNQNYNMQGWSQEQMYYYQNQYYQGFGQMGNNNYNMLNASKPIGSIPPINPELCPTPTNIGQVNQPILGQIPSDNKPILGEAPDNAPLLGTAPMGHQPMLGGAPMNSNMNMGVNSMNPMMAQNFMNPMMNQMMGQNPMNNMNQMMGQNSMNNMMGQSNINPIMLQSNNMHGQSNMNPMMNQGSMMGQGISISNMGMNLMNSISHSSMNNPMSQQPLSMNVTQGNFNSNLSQTALNPLDNLNFNMRQGFSNDNNLSENSQISNSTSISTGLSSTTQTPSVNGQNNSIEQNSTNHSLDPQVSQVKVNQELDCNLDSNTFITATISALLETPKSKTEFGDSLLGPPPSNGKQNAPLLKETNRESLLDTPSSGPTQYNFSSSKEENIPLLGSDGQLTQSEAAKKMDEIRSQRGILLDALATWEIKSDEEASAAMKVINRLTQSLTTYKLKNTTSSVKSVLLNSVTGAKEVEDLLGLQQK